MSNDEEKSFIYIEFADIGSAEITNYDFNNVSPFQILATAGLLEFEGKNALAMQKAAQLQAQMMEEQRGKTQILVPDNQIGIGK
jgi:hypothetical protein